MNDTDIARVAVDEGLLSSVELDRVRKEAQTQNEPLLAALLQHGLLRNSDIDRIRRDGRAPGSATTRIPGEIITSTHSRHMPDEARSASLDDKSQFGRYTLVEKIGSGGMGTIWKSWDNTLGRWCAMKMLHREHSAHDDHRERFLREARAAARLAHPNIVQVYEAGQLGEDAFIALEYVPGETLRQRIAHRATGPELRRRIELVRQAAEGLASAHAAGITHRDMKPENVLVLPTPKGGQSKVTDFGLAVDKTVVTRLTIAGDVFGTPAYMAPEQALGLQEIVGPPTDVFATGCILYEIVAGKLPFDNDAAAASVYATIHTEPDSLRKHAPRTHRDLETIIYHCLEKDPTKRYPTARELAEDLGRYMAGEPIVARPVGMIGRWKRRAGRNPAAAFAVAAAILLGFFLLGLVGYQNVAEADDIERELDEVAELEALAVGNSTLLNLVLARYRSVADRDPNNERAVTGMQRAVAAVGELEDQGRTGDWLARETEEALSASRDPARFAAGGVLCDILVRHHPRRSGSWEARAEWRWRAGLPLSALDDLEEARRVGGESSRGRHLRIMCLIDAGLVKEARPLLGESGDLETLVEGAAVLLSEGRRDEARRGLAMMPVQTGESLFVLGLLDSRSTGFAGGLAAFEACVKADPAFIPARLAAVRGLRESKRLPEALRRARDAVEIAPGLLEPRLVLADLLERSGDRVAALRELDVAVRLADCAPVRHLRGALRMRAGDARAHEDFVAIR